VTKSPRARDVVLEELAEFPDAFHRAVLANADDEALYEPAEDGGWGVVEIIPHLRDWEEIYFDRARAIVDQDRPHLPAFDDELWAIERDYRGQDPRQTFERFRSLRQEFVAFLGALPPEAWQRTGIHGAYGEITLLWMADHIANHDREHLDQARNALA
jgi:hypothetical protein